MGKGKRNREVRKQSSMSGRELYLQGYERALKDFRDQIVCNVQEEISWVGDKRFQDIAEFTQATYKKMKNNLR
jgi:hypothetical protein